MKNTTTKNPIAKNPLLKEIMKGRTKNTLSSNIKNNKVDFKKDFQIICTDETLNERKIAILVANSGYNFKDYFIQVFALSHYGYYEGCTFNEWGDIITNRDFNYRDLAPYNNFSRKVDFLKEIRNSQNKYILIQKREYIKERTPHIKPYDRLTRFIKIDGYRYARNGDTHYTDYFWHHQIEKSGYNTELYKRDLTFRLEKFKEQKRLKEYQELKNKNHLNKTKETLKKLLLNALDNFVLKIKNATLKNMTYYKNNNYLVWAFEKLNTLDNLKSVKDLTSKIKSILSTVKDYE